MCRASWQGRRSVFRFRGWFPIPGGMVGTRDLQRDHFPRYPFRRFLTIQTVVLKICHFCRFGLQLFAKHKFREVFKKPQSPINIDFFEVIHIFSCRFGRFRSIFHAIVQYSQTNFLLIFRISVRVFSPVLVVGYLARISQEYPSPFFAILKIWNYCNSRSVPRISPPGSAADGLHLVPRSVPGSAQHSLSWLAPSVRFVFTLSAGAALVAVYPSPRSLLHFRKMKKAKLSTLLRFRLFRSS